MAVKKRELRASKERVFEFLSDARQYPKWVVGARAFRGVEGDFPQPGSLFHHQAGLLPFVINDCTQVLSLDPPRCILLEASGSIFGAAEVKIELEDSTHGCTVTITETPVRGVGFLISAALQPLIKLRNTESLRRFADLVENQAR